MMNRLINSSLTRIAYKRCFSTLSKSVDGNRSIFEEVIRCYSSSSLPPHIKIALPALSPTMEKGNIGSWVKKVGDKISPGDILMSIETDKATMEFECQDEGYLANIFIPSGTKDVPINTLVAILSEKKEDLAKFSSLTAGDFGGPEKVAAPPASTPAVQPTSESPTTTTTVAPTSASTTSHTSAPTSTTRKFVSPAARRLAAEKGVSLDSISGTGPNGRVVIEDVQKFLTSTPAKSTPSAEKPTATKQAPLAEGTPFTDIPHTNVRRVIASRLTQSKQSIPHFYLTIDVKVDKLLKMREQLNEKSEEKISVNDFIIKACAKSLIKVPQVNSSWQGEFIRQYHNADISVAVSTKGGLITPIVFAAEQKGLGAIASNVKDLASRAREGKLAPHEYQGGTFSISNLGMFGIKSFTAIINPPQSCILAVGTTQKVVVPDDSKPEGFSTASMMSVTLSCDHRVVDGAVGADWLKAFKGYVEEPITMLL